MKTHPLVLGLLVALLVDAVMRHAPASISQFIFRLALIVVPATMIAIIEWFTRLDDTPREDNEDQIDL
jgi:hypothetical protein